jgi:excisionase family DNA binding protein
MERQASRFERFLTIKDVADLLSVHPMTIYKLLKEGRMPGVRFGGVWRFSRRAIEKWERDQERRGLGRTASDSRSIAVKRS